MRNACRLLALWLLTVTGNVAAAEPAEHAGPVEIIDRDNPCESLLMQRLHYPEEEIPEGISACAGWNTSEGNLARMFRASTSINERGSGTIITRDGLVLTNQHVIIPEVGIAANSLGLDIVETGCWAATPEEALPVPGLEILVRDSAPESKQTTRLVLEVVTDDMTTAEAGLARKEEMRRIKKECENEGSDDDTKFVCLVDDVRPGLKYTLHKWRAYPARLTLLPPKSLVYRDDDNFEHGLGKLRLDFAEVVIDCSGKKCKLPYVPFSPGSLEEDKRGLSIGHPGSTLWNRTAANARFNLAWDSFWHDNETQEAEWLWTVHKAQPDLRAGLTSFILSTENNVKVHAGKVAAAEAIIAARVEREAALNGQLSGPEALEILEEDRQIHEMYSDNEVMVRTALFERWAMNPAFFGPRYQMAWAMARHARVLAMPEEKRLAGWTKKEVVDYFNRYIPDEAVELEVAHSINYLVLMSEHVQEFADALGSQVAEEELRKVFRNTALRKERALELIEDGPEAILATDDPLLALARVTEEIGWESRATYARISEARTKASKLISGAILAQYGDTAPADSTGGPRFVLSETRGYSENGDWVFPSVTFADAVVRAERGEIELPDWFIESARGDQTVGNIALELIMVGGQSGSGRFVLPSRTPYVDAVLFDGNEYSTSTAYWKGGPRSRGIVVTGEGIERFKQIAGACHNCGPRKLPPCRPPGLKVAP